MTTNWKSLPRVTIPSPVLTLSADQNGIWAGGLGGIAWRKFYGDWEPKVALTGVATIAPTPTGALAGSSEGLLYTEDHGETWHTAETPPDIGGVIAITLSPNFASDGQALAATTQKGVVRSTDGGRTWESSQLVIVQTEQLLWSSHGVHAATNAGLYHSADNGHVWHPADDCFGQPFISLTQLGDGRLVAAEEAGQLWFSTDGQTWHQQYTLPAKEGKLFTLFAPPKTSTTLLASIAERGLYLTTDAGENWRKVHNTAALSLASWDDKILAGLTDGFQVSHTGGISWVDWPTPQIHDLHQLEVIDETAVLIGRYTSCLRYQQGPGWHPLLDLPRPAAAHTLTTDNTLFIATIGGLYQSTDTAETWEKISERDDLSHLSSREDGTLFAAVTNGSQLLSSADGGQSWQTHKIPFGEASLVALTAMPHLVLAATYQHEPQQVIIWLSGDSGDSWQQAAVIPTNWPLVSAWPQPPLLTVGNLLLKQTIVGWQQRELSDNEAPFRALTGCGENLFALTTEGLWHSADKAINWNPIPLSVDAEYVVDIAVTAERIYILYIDGQVLYQPLPVTN